MTEKTIVTVALERWAPPPAQGWEHGDSVQILRTGCRCFSRIVQDIMQFTNAVVEGAARKPVLCAVRIHGGSFTLPVLAQDPIPSHFAPRARDAQQFDCRMVSAYSRGRLVSAYVLTEEGCLSAQEWAGVVVKRGRDTLYRIDRLSPPDKYLLYPACRDLSGRPKNPLSEPWGRSLYAAVNRRPGRLTTALRRVLCDFAPLFPK